MEEREALWKKDIGYPSQFLSTTCIWSYIACEEDEIFFFSFFVGLGGW